MKSAIKPLLICILAVLILTGGLLYVQFVKPLPAPPEQVYTQKKAERIFSYYEYYESAETLEDGKVPFEIYIVTVEEADYEKTDGIAYFYSFDAEKDEIVSFSSNAKKRKLKADTELNGKCIEAAYGEFDTFSKISNKFQYDIPRNSETVKVYLTTSDGYYLREYTEDEFLNSVFADTYNIYKEKNN